MSVTSEHCRRKADNGSGAVVAGTTSDDAGPLTVSVTTDSDIVCVITNTRETGKLEVQKDLSPRTDGGLFNLQIDGSTDGEATNVGDGGSTAAGRDPASRAASSGARRRRRR